MQSSNLWSETQAYVTVAYKYLNATHLVAFLLCVYVQNHEGVYCSRGGEGEDQYSRGDK